MSRLIIVASPQRQAHRSCLIDEQVEKVRFQEENERVLQLGLQPAKAEYK